MKQRHAALAQLAQAVVWSADETIAIFRGEPTPSSSPLPDHLPLYRNHRRIMQLVGELSNPPHEPTDTAAVGFLVQIWLRCAYVYLRLPGHLLREARHGEPDALDKLLRLDKTAICEPRVARNLAEIFHSGRPGMKARMTKAMKGAPRNPRRRTLKARMAAVIIEVARADSQLVEHGVEPPVPADLRDLFDAIAKDASGRQQCDTDLPVREDTWRKAVRRAGKELRPFVEAAVNYAGWTKLAR
jgi:hypothetical protein